MKRYTVYAWCSDDEGGEAVCLSSDWNPMIGYDPESGWRAEPSKKIGEFDTKEDLKQLLYEADPDWYDWGYGNLAEDVADLSEMVHNIENQDTANWEYEEY